MDYEKKYKELAGKIKKAYLYAQTDSTKAVLEDILPELKESDDERIRKNIVDFINRVYERQALIITDEDRDNWIAWLEKLKVFAEHGDGLYYFGNNGFTYVGNPTCDNVSWLKKQGEKPQGKSALEAIKEEKVDNANKVEPKFKVGDWIIDKQGIIHQIANVVENVTNHTYGYDIVGGGYFNDNTEGVRLWTIEDAKPGDVLVVPKIYGSEHSEQIFIFKEIKDREYVKNAVEYSCRVVDNEFCVNERGFMGQSNDYFVPATKEQCDLLFSKMKEEGYEWDGEKKELKKE